jgi:hypothetical protein
MFHEQRFAESTTTKGKRVAHPPAKKTIHRDRCCLQSLDLFAVTSDVLGGVSSIKDKTGILGNPPSTTGGSVNTITRSAD